MLRARSTLALAALVSALGTAAAAPLKLHVPSPDWRDQVIYFVVTDRFADGDPRNNDQGAGEFQPGAKNRYNGGDLKGLRERLDYIGGLGATALWITPPVANQWFDPRVDYAGYHGYWAENFKRVDAHLGTLADYQRLSDALHRRGMVLVQDIVVNHTGNFFSYGPGHDRTDPTRGYAAHTGTRPVPRPSQPPFDLNDPREPTARRAGIYHWTPDILDYTDKFQELNHQMAGLDDLDTENPAVRRALRDSYGFWVREVGVDAFRVDTAFYVPADFFDDFLRSPDRRAPGIENVARATGRHGFLTFGEGFGIDKPYQDLQAKKIEAYMTGADGRPLMPGMLNFPLYGAMGDVFARGRPTAELGHRITAMMRLHARPHLMPTFVDNHDVDRFLAGGTEAGLKQALLAMMTLPGIPVLYYGTEQGFKQPRAAMFAAGWGSGGRDRYDTAHPLYRYTADVVALRRAHKALSRGTPVVLRDNAASAGALAWRMDHEGQSLITVLNTADHEVLLDHLDTGAPAGRVLEGVFGLHGRPADQVAGVGGRIHLRLPARAGLVFRVGTRQAPLPAVPAALTLDPLPATLDAPARADFVVGGSARGTGRVQVVVDGDLAGARSVVPGPDGRWQVLLDTSAMTDPAVRHHVVAWADDAGTASPAAAFRVEREWTLLADVADPPGDDAGPQGRYRYPLDASYGDNRQMDLRRVRVLGAGGALRLELDMHRVTTSWSPANGFDHVAFTIFIELPGQPGGATVLPQQNAALPAGMRWHRRLRVHGWSNALFSDDGASAQADGRAISPGAAIAVDRERGRIGLTLPAAALGGMSSLSGAKVYVTTWDYDGGYRGLAPQPAQATIGGGDAGVDPKVMDDSAVIVLP